MAGYLRSAGRWSSSLKLLLDNASKSCPWTLATPPEAHAIVSASPPTARKHEQSQVDVVFFDTTLFLHNVDLATSWSRVDRLRMPTMSDQCSIYVRLWTSRHGPPELLQTNGECDNNKFRNLCAKWKINLPIVAAHHHDANGVNERASRTLRLTFDRLRAADHRISLDDLVLEATYGKNLVRWSKLVSSFELLYAVQPCISDDLKFLLPPAVHPWRNQSIRLAIASILCCKNNCENPKHAILFRIFLLTSGETERAGLVQKRSLK